MAGNSTTPPVQGESLVSLTVEKPAAPTVDEHAAPAMVGDSLGSGGGRNGEVPSASLEDRFAGLNLRRERRRN